MAYVIIPTSGAWLGGVPDDELGDITFQATPSKKNLCLLNPRPPLKYIYREVKGFWPAAWPRPAISPSMFLATPPTLGPGMRIALAACAVERARAIKICF